jgi:hypothetical protein
VESTVMMKLLFWVLLLPLPQDESTILRRDLNEEGVAFIEVFSALARENRTAELEKHVKENLGLARDVFERLDISLMGAGREAFGPLGTRLKLLADWLDRFEKTKHWRRYADYITSIEDPARRAEREKALVDLARADALYDQILADWPDLTKQPECYELLDNARGILEEIDDPRSLARVHLLVARNAFTEKDLDHLYREIAITRELWRKAGLPSDDEGSLWMIEQLRQQQKRDAEGTGQPEPTEKPKEDWQRVPLVAVKDAKAGHIKTPAFASEDPRTWNDFVIGGNATHALPARLHPFGRSLSLVRADDDYRLEDLGKRESIALRPGKVCPVTLPQASGSSAPPYTVLLSLGDKETLFGQNVSNAPTPDRALIRWRSGCHLEGELAGRKWLLFDDNDSGQFGDVVEAYDEYAGEKLNSRFCDAVAFGTQTRAVPFSEYLVVDGTLMRIKVDGATGTLLVQSGACGLGKISLDWAGPVKPRSLVVMGLDDRSSCFYDLAAGGEISVPTGKYRVAYGVLETGKGSSLQRALILPGSSPAVEVKDGATAVMALGAPFRFRFESGAKAGEAFVVGTSVQVTGRAGEAYARFSEVPLPLVTAKTKDNRLLVRAKAMDPPTPAEWSKSLRALAYPKDFRIKSDAADGVSFELELRSHPLLGGPIQSGGP